MILRADSIFLRLTRADACEGVVRAHQIHVKADSPVGRGLCPNSEDSSVFIDLGGTCVKAGVGRDEGERAVSIRRATCRKSSSRKCTRPAIGIIGEINERGGGKETVGNRPVPIPESGPRANLGGNLVCKLREVCFFILLQKITVQPNRNVGSGTCGMHRRASRAIRRPGASQWCGGKRRKDARRSEQI